VDGRVGRRLQAGRAGGKGEEETPAATIIFYPNHARGVPLVDIPHVETHCVCP